jgi:hypothetical protein
MLKQMQKTHNLNAYTFFNERAELSSALFVNSFEKINFMKKILFTCIFSVSIVLVNAQVNKGAILLGGNISSQTYTNDDGTSKQTSSRLLFQPSLGFAYKPNKIVGFSLGYGSGEDRSPSGSFTYINRYKQYSAGIYLRHYFPIGKSFSLFAQGDLGFGYMRRNITNPPLNGSIQKTSSVALNFTPGISYAINKRISLEASVGNLLNIQYQTTKSDYTGTTPPPTQKVSSLNVSANGFSTGYNLGFRFMLKNK